MNRFFEAVRASVWGRVWLPLAANLLMLMAAYMLCRFIFLGVHHEVFSSLSWHGMKELVRGGLRFDWAALCYTNALYLILLLMPLPYKETVSYQHGLKVLFVVMNSLAILANLMDTACYSCIGRRTTSALFAGTGFGFGSGVAAGDVGLELLKHCYLLLPGILLIWGMWRFYRMTAPLTDADSGRPYYIRGGVQTGLALLVVVFGIRGGMNFSHRPIDSRSACRYVERPAEAALVLNTPFSICRTLGKRPYVCPAWFTTEEELGNVYSPEQRPKSRRFRNSTNVMVLYVGEGDKEVIDSLKRESLSFEHSFANGNQGVDVWASVWLSIPKLVEPYLRSHAAMNRTDGLVSLLESKGYTPVGFSLKEDAWPDVAGGKSGIRNQQSDIFATLPEPFVSGKAFASASSCLSARQFLGLVRRQPWYARTLFVILSKETILFHHPTDKRLRGVRPGIAQHTDIMPTVLGYLGYDKPYVAFGQDLLHTAPENTSALCWQDGLYLYYKGDLLLQHDGTNAVGLYDFKRDPALETDQLNQRFPLKRQEMERELKAFIRQYMQRMAENRLTNTRK